jgi:hypothetical protein
MLDKFIESLTAEQKMALIQTISDSMEPEVKEEPKSVVKVAQESHRDVNLDFTVSKEASREKTKVPVTETKRFNSFTDDGTEAQGSEFKTPDIQPTQRRRPPVNKVNQKCTKCDKTVKVHPTHARDWFICDRCIGVR